MRFRSYRARQMGHTNRPQNFMGALRNRRTWTENALGAGSEERVVVLRRDDAADEDHNIACALFLERFHQLRHQRPVAGSERRHADRMHIVFDGLARTVNVEFQHPTFYMVDGDIMDPTRQLTIAPGPIV